MKKNIKILKKKLKNFDPKLKEECGVFGVSNAKDASALAALGLHALQHRGQEGCGIVTFDGEKYYSEKRFGLVGDNFSKEKVLKNLKGNYAIGHNRYSTTGENTLRNIQPFFADTNAGGIGVAHNGNLTNSISLRNKLVEDGAIFYTTSDTETIVQLIAKSKRPKTIDKVVDAIFQIQGGYALVMLTQHSLIGVRDPYGIRPLVIGKLGNSYVLASETCALDIIGAKFVRDVENGEIVLIENDKLTSVKPFPPKKVRPCVFEYIYFARPDSILDNKTAYEHRKNIGVELAKENDIDFEELRNQIGFVTQDTQLFAGTIRENLSFVFPNATDAEMIIALEKASCHSILSKAQQGLDSIIGEGGLKLSGGEKQRLSIARALLRHPHLLIFDEATSSLDSITEEEITRTIHAISEEREQITVMIAHRLSTIMHANRIYVLEKGQIVETGTHEALLAEKGLYYAMWRQQIGERKVTR